MTQSWVGFMGSLRVFLGLLAAAVKSDLAYRLSFLLEIGGRLIVTGVELLAIGILFQRFPNIMGWGLWEVVYLYGVGSVSFGLAEILSSGIQSVPLQVQSGAFDRVLVRPLSPLLQALSSAIHFRNAGRVLQGAVAFGLSVSHLDIHWNAERLAMLLVSLVSGFLIYFGVFLASAAGSFFTVEGKEAFNAFTYGGVELTQFPVSIYEPWLRSVFLFLVPVGFVSYFPALVVLGKPDPLGFPGYAPWLSPFVALAFLAACGRFWSLGIRHYQSTGS